MLRTITGSSAALVLDNFDFTFVPEPSVAMLLVMGLVTLVCSRSVFRKRG